MTLLRRAGAVSALTAAMLLSGCTPTPGAPDPHPTDPASSAPASAEAEPAPALADGPLETVSEGAPAIPVDESLIHPGITVADPHVYIVSADNVLHAYASDTAEELWATPLPRHSLDSGVCAGPEVAEDGTVVVLLGISLGCERRIAIDQEDGAIIADELIVDGQAQEQADRQVKRDGEEQLGGDHVVGLLHVGDELWFHTFDGIGRIGERGAVDLVMDAAQLGVVEDDETGDYTAVYDVSALADDRTFVTQLAHVQGDGSDTWSEWIGYDAASSEPRELWRVSEREDSRFGIDGVAEGGPLLVYADRPGALVVTQTADGLVRAGVPDPEDGQVAAATIAEDLDVSLTQSFASDAEFALLDDGFVTTAAKADADEGSTMLVAYSSAGGELWRTQLPPIDEYVGDVSGDVGDVHRDAEGTTYAVYSDLYSGARLHRVDTATGEMTGSWDLPEWAVSIDDAHEMRVVGEHVFAVRTSGDEAAGPLVAVWRGTDPDEQSEPEPVPTDVPAATGPLLEVPGAQLHLTDAVEWEILPAEEISDGVFQTQGFAQTDEGDIWDVGVTRYPWDDDAAAAAVTTAELVYTKVGEPTTRTIAGIDAGFVESIGVRDPLSERQVDDLGATIVLPGEGMTIEIGITVPLDTPENRIALESMIASITLG